MIPNYKPDKLISVYKVSFVVILPVCMLSTGRRKGSGFKDEEREGK